MSKPPETQNAHDQENRPSHHNTAPIHNNRTKTVEGVPEVGKTSQLLYHGKLTNNRT